MSAPERPDLPRTERRHRAARRRARRIAIGAGIAVLLVAAGAGAVVLRGGGDGDDDERAVRTTQASTTSSSTTTTAAPVEAESVPADPVACLHGTYRLASQTYSGPVATAFGPTQLEGGEEGRTIELRPDGTFSFNDTGAASTRFTLLDTNITGSATLAIQSGGTYTATPETVTVDVTSLTGTLTAVTDDGQTLDIPLPADGAGVEETFGFTPDAPYTCDRDTVTVTFTVLTLVLERQPQS